MAQVKMTLQVSIEGTSIQDVQQGLILAALQGNAGVVHAGAPTIPGETARADLVNEIPPAPMVKVPPQGEPPAADEEMERGAHNAEVKKAIRKSKQSKAQTEEKSVSTEGTAPVEQKAQDAVERAVASEALGGTPSRADAVAALTEVNKRFDMDTAKACLTQFGAAKLSELADDKIADFVSYCRGKLGETVSA